MRFQVPQFIGVEDKIFGPFTAKQFVYLVGGAGLCYIIFKFLPLFVAIIVVIPVALISVALAIIKINDKPFIFILEAGLKYFMGSKLYLWKKGRNVASKTPGKGAPGASLETSDFAPRLSESKLKELTWSLDVKEEVRK